MCLVIAVESTERDGEAVEPATDELQRDIELVAMDADEDTGVDLLLPDGQIRMVRVDLLLRLDLSTISIRLSSFVRLCPCSMTLLIRLVGKRDSQREQYRSIQ